MAKNKARDGAQRSYVWIWTVVCGIAWFVSIGCESNEMPAMQVRYGEGTQPVKILRHYSGSDPGFKYPGLNLINSRQQLMDMGSIDLIDRGIDFDTESLLVLTLGKKPTSGYRAWITGVQHAQSDLFVQGSANRPTHDQIIMNMHTFPYDAVVIAKIHKAHLHSEIVSVSGQRTPLDR